MAKIELGLLIVTTDDGVVRTLEEAVFAVAGELERGLHEIGVKARIRGLRESTVEAVMSSSV